MSLTLERLVFNPAQPTDGPTMGSYLIGADGTVITHTTVGGKEAIDVNVANPITVAVDAANDSIVSWTADGTGNLIGSTSGALNVFLTNTSVAVTATNLDIRDLSHTQDSVKIGDGTDFLAVNTDGSINITDNGGSLTVDGTVAATQSGSWTVAATQSGTWTTGRTWNLASGSDSVTAIQGTSPWVTSATQSGTWTVGLSEDHNYGTVGAATLRTAAQIGNASGAADFGAGSTSAQTLRVALASDTSISTSDAALANTSVAAAAQSVTTTAAALSSPLANRKYLFLQNRGSSSIFVGPSGVTSSSGLEIGKGSTLEARIGAAVALYAVAASGTQDVRKFELS